MSSPLQRVAVLGDVHGNRPALQAVLREIQALTPAVDLVVLAGDLCSLGPEPEACLDDLLALPAVRFVRGNHDRYMLGGEPGPGVPPSIVANIDYHRSRLSPAVLDQLRTWPPFIDLTLGSSRIRIAHATPDNDELAIHPDQAGSLLPPGFDGLVLAHVHQPWIRHDPQRVLCNCGSVGAPLDGDRRASWLILDDASGRLQVTLQRTAYDVEETVGRLLATAAPFKEALAATLRTARLVAAD